MRRSYPIITFLVFLSQLAFSQSVIGVWRGKVSRGLKQYSMELKLVRQGDSLKGTSYYYSGSSYARFAILGTMTIDGDVLWWDEELIESRGNSMAIPNKTANLFAADFNCPGEDIMKLDGNAVKKDDKGSEGEKPADVHLTKVVRPLFSDPWDEVIANYPSYAASPGMIREIDREQRKGEGRREKVEEPLIVKTVAPPAEPTPTVQKPEPNVEEMFNTRKKIIVTEIPVTADSILLRFYDHAEIDGDSISLFLNSKLIHKHVLLAAEPLEIWISAADLNEENELTMVAENLGTIPPNTSLMIAYCNGTRYEARLESTENTSATVRLIKRTISKNQQINRQQTTD